MAFNSLYTLPFYAYRYGNQPRFYTTWGMLLCDWPEYSGLIELSRARVAESQRHYLLFMHIGYHRTMSEFFLEKWLCCYIESDFDTLIRRIWLQVFKLTCLLHWTLSATGLEPQSLPDLQDEWESEEPLVDLNLCYFRAYLPSYFLQTMIGRSQLALLKHLLPNKEHAVLHAVRWLKPCCQHFYCWAASRPHQ